MWNSRTTSRLVDPGSGAVDSDEAAAPDGADPEIHKYKNFQVDENDHRLTRTDYPSS